MPARPDVPVERTVIETRDLGEVLELHARRYVDHRAQILYGARNFVFRSRAARAGVLTVESCLYRAGMAIAADPLQTVLVVSVLDGRFDVTAGRHRSRVAAGGSLLLPPHTAVDVLLDRMTYQVVQFPGATPARIAGRLGIEAADFRFEAMTPVSGAANRQWLATVAYLTRLLADPGLAGVSALLLGAAVDTAATAALVAFPNTTMALDYLPGPGGAAPTAVRRATAYIDAHVTEPITLDDIAAASGLGVRALQMAFRRHLDVTPLGYLRRVRLEHAHHELQAADPTTGTTVAEIARRWGFAGPGRFAGHYRAAYGRAPSRTLHT